MMSLLLVLAFVQDTVSEFKLERYVPKNWDLYVEIDGVENLVGDYKASKTGALVADALKAVKDQTGADPLGQFQHNLGVSVEELAGLVKGQLAMALSVRLRGGANVVVTADCRSTENAQKLAALIGARLPNGKEIQVGDVMGTGSKEGPTVAAAGPVVYLGSTWETCKEFVNKRTSESSNVIGDEETFKKAREAAGAGPGGVFAWANLGKFTPFLAFAPADAKDAIEKSGLAGLKGYAASIRFEGGRVVQRHILQAGDKPGGLLGELLSIEDKAASLKAAPKETAAGIYLSKEFVGILQRLGKLARDASGGAMDPEAERIFAPILGTATSLGVEAVKGGDSFSFVFYSTAAVEVVENLLDLTAVLQVMTEDKEVDGATITKVHLPDNNEFPFTGVGVTDDRAYLALDIGPIEAVHKAIKSRGATLADDDEVKALGDVEGAAVIYLDFAKAAEIVKSVVEKTPAMKAGAEKIDVVVKLLARAGRSVEIIRAKDGALIIESRSTTGLSVLTALAAAAIAGNR